MAATLIGGNGSTPVDRNTFRYRITWIFTIASLVPDSTLNAHAVATQLRDFLPSAGLIPVSPIAALTGDPFIQFTCQVGAVGPGANIRTLADLVQAANALPLLSGTVALRAALEVSEVEIRASGLPGTIVQAQDQVSRERAFKAAEQRDVVNKATGVIGDIGNAVGDAVKDAAGAAGSKFDDYLKGLFGGLKDVAYFALGVAGIAAVVYVIVRYRQ